MVVRSQVEHLRNNAVKCIYRCVCWWCVCLSFWSYDEEGGRLSSLSSPTQARGLDGDRSHGTILPAGQQISGAGVRVSQRSGRAGRGFRFGYSVQFGTGRHWVSWLIEKPGKTRQGKTRKGAKLGFRLAAASSWHCFLFQPLPCNCFPRGFSSFSFSLCSLQLPSPAPSTPLHEAREVIVMSRSTSSGSWRRTSRAGQSTPAAEAAAAAPRP